VTRSITSVSVALGSWSSSPVHYIAQTFQSSTTSEAVSLQTYANSEIQTIEYYRRGKVVSRHSRLTGCYDDQHTTVQQNWTAVHWRRWSVVQTGTCEQRVLKQEIDCNASMQRCQLNAAPEAPTAYPVGLSPFRFITERRNDFRPPPKVIRKFAADLRPKPKDRRNSTLVYFRRRSRNLSRTLVGL